MKGRQGLPAEGIGRAAELAGNGNIPLLSNKARHLLFPQGDEDPLDSFPAAGAPPEKILGLQGPDGNSVKYLRKEFLGLSPGPEELRYGRKSSDPPDS